MKLRYTPAAICDLEEVESYIRDVLMNPDAAANIIGIIADSCAKLKEQPYMGGELRQKLNREMDGRFLICQRYIVIYEVDEAVSVLRVLDTRTDYAKVLISELSSK